MLERVLVRDDIRIETTRARRAPRYASIKPPSNGVQHRNPDLPTNERALETRG
jgi:hypothetical protein